MLNTVAETLNPNIQSGPIPVAQTLPTLPDGFDQTCCTTEQFAVIRSIGNARTFEKGDVIFHEDEPNDRVYFVLSGVVRCSKILADGRRVISKFIYPGQLIEYDEQQRCPYTAEAIVPIRAVSIPRRSFDRAVSETPHLKNFLMRTLLAELQEAQLQVLALARLSATERVAQFIYSLFEKLEQDESGAVQIPMSRLDMADYLGLTIETVSRVFSRLKHEGSISLLEKNRFIIRDEDDFLDEFLANAM